MIFRMRTRRRAVVSPALALAFVLLGHVAGAAADPVPIPQAVQDRVLRAGGGRVIVELRLPAGPPVAEGQLATQAAVSMQRQDISAAQARVMARLRHAAHKVLHRFQTVPVLVLEVDATALAELQAVPQDVRRVTEDLLHVPLLAQSVPLIQADQVWARGFDGSGFTVAVLDSGVDKNHPFLVGKVVAEACFARDINGVGWCPNGEPTQIGAGAAAPCSYAADDCAHGTHVAGIAAGAGAGASVGFSGVAPGSNLIAVQVFHADRTTCRSGESIPCARTFSSDVLRALEQIYLWRTTYSIAAVNLSFGASAFSTNCDGISGKAVIDNLRSVGIATIASAGNQGLTDSLSAPACISSVISVGSTTKTDTVSWFSNNASFLSLLAPGGAADGVPSHDIRSSVPGAGFADFPGTSMAAPHVAGAWALLKQAVPSASVDDILALLQRTGQPVIDTRNGISITKPRIRVAAALNELTSPVLESIAPERAPAGGAAFALTLNGTNFAEDSVVQWNGSARQTTFVSTRQLRATITAADIAVAGSASVRVVSPGPGGGTSSARTFTVLPLAALLSPAPGSTLNGTTVTFTWSAATGAVQYWLNVGTTVNGIDIYSASQGTALSRTISGLPSDGRTIHLRLWTQLTSGGPFIFTDYTFTAFTLSVQPAALASPAPGSTLPGTSVTFTWTAGTGAIEYWLNVGTTVNGVDIYSASQGTVLSRTITGLPADGRTIHVRLWTKFTGGGPFVFTDYAFTTSTGSVQPAGLTGPAPGSTLPGTSVTFTWSAAAGAVQYWLNVGTTINGVDIYSASQGTALSRTISGLPSDGRTIHVRLWTRFTTGGPFVFTDYTFTASAVSAQPAALTSPAPGSALPGASVTFTWTAGTGAIQYWLNVGTTVNGVDIYSASQGTALSRTITGLPSDGRTIHVRLWTKFTSGGPFVFTDYTFTTSTVSVQPAALTSPAPGSTLPGASVTFTWTAGTGAIQYWLNVGTTVNGVDIYSASQGTVLSRTIIGLPADGRTIHVRLWTRFTTGAPFVFTDYAFTAARVTAQPVNSQR